MWRQEYLADVVMITKEKILDSLYSRCQTRTYKTEEVIELLSKDLNITICQIDRDKLTEIVRPYKQTGKHLEATVDAINTVIGYSAPKKDDFGTYIQPNLNMPIHNHIAIPGLASGILGYGSPTPRKVSINLQNGNVYDISDYIIPDPNNHPNRHFTCHTMSFGPPKQGDWVGAILSQDPGAQFFLQKDDSFLIFSNGNLYVLPK